jgi:hypothetical protein
MKIDVSAEFLDFADATTPAEGANHLPDPVKAGFGYKSLTPKRNQGSSAPVAS